MKFINRLKGKIKSNPKSKFSYFVAFIYTLWGFNRIVCKRGNRINKKNCYLKRCHIEIYGKNNIIDFGSAASYLTKCHIYVNGNNNIIKLGERNTFINGELWIEDNAGQIYFGNRNQILGRTHIAVIEGTSITFGDECLFSTDVTLRTGDSHSILSVEDYARLNPSKSIVVGNKVWFGNKTTILKGVEIKDNCVIGTGALVVKSIDSNSIVAGNPARVIKQDIIWNIQRLPV